MKIDVGVRGIPEGDWLGSVDIFELDALDSKLESLSSRRRTLGLFKSHQKLALCFSHFFIRGEDSSDRRERARLALERYVAYGAESSCILVPPSFAHSLTLKESLNHFYEEFTSAGLDPPRVDAVFDGRFPLERIGDPAWRKTKVEYLAKEWRIHGYHSTRWVRMYSNEALNCIAKAAIRYQPQRIIFAHSQRFIQAQEFMKLIF